MTLILISRLTAVCQQMLTVTMFVILKYLCYICKQIVNIMDTRLQQFLSAENISQSQFADNIGVARASVSHILSGRNRPGFDFIERMAKCYPALNLEWLITGKGRMYKAENEAIAPKLWEEEQAPVVLSDTVIKTNDSPIFSERRTLSKAEQIPVNQRSISKIVVFYDDNTFQELK